MCNYCTKDKLCYYHKKIEDGLIDAPEETNEYLEEQRQVWDYIPLVRGTADKLEPFTNIEYLDLCQAGYLILAELASKLDWSLDSPMISNYIKKAIVGGMKNYIAQHDKVVRVPRWDAAYFDDSVEAIEFDDELQCFSNSLNPEQEYEIKEQTEKIRKWIAVFLKEATEREHYVLFHCLYTDDPEPYRDVGDQFRTSKDSIFRDVSRITARLKEIANGNL